MKARVRLTYTVELTVEGKNREEIEEWLNNSTPMEARNCCEDCCDEEFNEEILCEVKEDSIVDYVIK